MRIISGKYKRTPIKTLEGEDITRPTRDMVKEAVFSTISINSDDTFLDLFAGSGSIGLEALSRGAKDVVFNDSNIKAVKIINTNLDKIHEIRDVYNLDYQECLRRISGRKFDYIYLDPPYDFKAYEEIFYYINKNDVLSIKGIIILEVKKETELLDNYLNYSLYKEKTYGINKILYYRNGD